LGMSGGGQSIPKSNGDALRIALLVV